MELLQLLDEILPRCEGVRNGGSQGDEGNCVDRVFQIEETAEMLGDVSDYCRENANRENGDDKCGVAIEDGRRGNKGNKQFPRKDKDMINIVPCPTPHVRAYTSFKNV